MANRKYSDEDRAQIGRAVIEGGMSVQRAAAMFGASKRRAQEIVREERERRGLIRAATPVTTDRLVDQALAFAEQETRRTARLQRRGRCLDIRELTWMTRVARLARHTGELVAARRQPEQGVRPAQRHGLVERMLSDLEDRAAKRDRATDASPAKSRAC